MVHSPDMGAHRKQSHHPVGVPEAIWGKVRQIRQAFTRRQVLRQGTHRDANTIQIVRRTGTFSYLNRKLYKEALAREIKAPPLVSF